MGAEAGQGPDPQWVSELIWLAAARAPTCPLDGADLRYVSYRGTEVLRRAYVAVRDLTWGTVPAIIVRREIDAGDGQFRVTSEISHRQGPVAFASVIEVH